MVIRRAETHFLTDAAPKPLIRLTRKICIRTFIAGAGPCPPRHFFSPAVISTPRPIGSLAVPSAWRGELFSLGAEAILLTTGSSTSDAEKQGFLRDRQRT